MKTETPRTDAVIRPLQNPELSYREWKIAILACELEYELSTARAALKSAESQLQFWLEHALDAEMNHSARLTLATLKTIRAAAMPNDQELSHAARDSRQPETRSENRPA